VAEFPRPFKAVRTDRELEMQRVDAQLRAAGGQLVVLPDGTPEDELAREVADAELLLMCYARISRRVIAGAPKLKAIINTAWASTPSTWRPRASMAWRWSTCRPMPRRRWPKAPLRC
jgi:hypothetical protein